MQGRRRAPLELRHPALAFWAIAVGVVALDQITKALIRASFAPGDSVPVIAGVLHLTYVRNMGAAFGLLPGGRPLFIGTSLFVLLVVGAYWRRWHPKPWPIVVALALVCSGAAGNLIDRALAGRVTDFFDLVFIDFPVFNIADSAIVVGVAVLTGWLLFGPDPFETADAADAADTPDAAGADAAHAEAHPEDTSVEPS